MNTSDTFTAEDAKVSGRLNTNDIATGVVEYLRLMLQMKIECRKHNNGFEKPSDWHYAGMEDLLLQHGRFWTPRQLPSHIPHMTPKMCFENAFRVASRRKNLRYVEGVAMGVIIPVHHAWCVDEDGNVIDPTWASTQTDVGEAYFGVTFPVTLVRRIRSRACLSVLDNWISGWEIYKQPFTAE